jgi:hypothetical protein
VTRSDAANRVEKRAAQEPVLDHVAHRAFLDLGVIELEHERVTDLRLRARP